MSSDILIIILVLFLSLLGIVGCFVPGMPGPTINYVALLIVQYRYNSYSIIFMIIWALIIALTVVIDYFLPIWVAKKYGATKYGIWGSIIGMLLGIFFTPVGMVLGMLIGAVVGELLGGSEKGTALKSGIATFAGTVLSIGVQLIVSIVLTVYIIVELTRVGF